MDTQQWIAKQRELEAAHGPRVGVSVVDPEVPKKPGFPELGTEPNPNPTYLFVYSDGTSVKVKTSGPPENTTYDIAALSEKAPASSNRPTAGTKRQVTVSDGQGGQLLVTQVADGYGGWSVDPSTPPAPYITKGTQPKAGQLVPVQDPRTGEVIALRDSVSGTVTTLPKQTAVDPADAALKAAQTGYYGAQTDYQNALTAKTLAGNTPAALKALQDYTDSVSAIRGMIEKGQMSPTEATGYMDAFKTNLMATLAGTTPWQMKQDQMQQEQAQADTARQLLTQRMATGSGIAQSLIGLLGSVGSRLLLPPGQTSIHFDPFEMAKQFTDEMSGGQGMSDTARALLGLGGPTAAGPAMPAPAVTAQSQTQGAPAALPASVGPVMGTIIQMLAAQPDLAKAAAAGANTLVPGSASQVGPLTPTVTQVQGVSTPVRPVVTDPWANK